MRNVCGIELGPDSCVIVAARRGRDATEVLALHVIEPGEWPAHDTAITAALRAVRRKKRFPRRAAVIVWGLPDMASAAEPSTRAAVRPIVDAGFRVESILTPPQALAALAAASSRPDGDAAIAWLALNRHGAAIAIVRNGELLFARSFDWIYQPLLQGSKAQLLQRYSLVAHLAPEVQRGIAAVRSSHGVDVTTAVTCGDLPELRSLTMPLIEELDLEVETLDSIDGLRAVGRARGERFAESAPAIRIAAAAAAAPRATRGASVSPTGRALAAAAILIILAWAVYRFWPVHPQAPPPFASGGAAPAAPASPQPAPPAASTPSPPAQTAPSVTTSQPARPGVGQPPVQAPPETRPAAPASPPASAPRPLPSAPSPRKPVETPAPGTPRAGAPPAAAPSPAAPPPVKPLPAPPSSATPSSATPTPRPPAPLAEPLPKVESILIDHNRRLAIIGGVVVRVGESVGTRVVVEIQPEAVVFREPSGRLVRVTLRGSARGGL